MKIAVLGTSRSGTDPRTTRLVTSLASAGHDVVFVSPGSVDARIDEAADQVITIDTRWPSRGGRISGPLRRYNPERLRKSIMQRRAMSALTSLQPDLVYVSDTELARLVDGLGLTIASDTKIRQGIANSLAATAPTEPRVAGLADPNLIPWVLRPTYVPDMGRHGGRKIVLCYHPTETTPARYLHAALERAGVAVDHRYPDIDLSELDADVDGVVFVESPYPALDVTGETAIPVVYWVHHGEIHLYQNLRLAQRYRADAVLLAHSWHLAYRFPSPVYRFPFGVPTEMLAGSVSFDERTLAVSMIAAGFDGTGGRYAQRRDLAEAVTQEISSERVLFTGGLTPAEMFAVYADSRAVLDEGGSLHRPITMRVFEATGSGAALVTDPAPGIELLYEPDTEFVTLDTVGSVSSLMASRDAAQIAAAGHARALGVHTYDHRVDELFSILDQLDLGSRGAAKSPAPPVQTGQQSDGVALQGDTSEERVQVGDNARSTADRPDCEPPIPLARRRTRRLSPLKGERKMTDSAGSKARPSTLKGGRCEEAGFLAVVERFAEIDSVACSETSAGLFASSSYLLLSHREVVEKHMTVDAVVISDESTPTPELLQRAHRYVFSSGEHAPTVATMLTQDDRMFVGSTEAVVHIFDLETPGYIVRDAP
jgi:hypothetical protein